jgi:Tol biopolymer transport system component
MLPINTKTNEGCPSLTADGNTIYFMRCDRMDQNKADACKLFFSKKKSSGQWDEPKELPANINTGNSQTPRIMADGVTLIFSSNKMPSNQGGMDLYVTKLVDGNWTEPKAMDFVNTPQDDQFGSVAALGRYLVERSTRRKKTVELVSE